MVCVGFWVCGSLLRVHLCDLLSLLSLRLGSTKYFGYALLPNFYDRLCFAVRARVRYVIQIALAFLTLALLSSREVECGRDGYTKLLDFQAINCRKHSAVLTDFGGKGDGKTSNTKAFQSAISQLSRLALDGGAQLIVPPGKWLPGSFNLTSHFTLYIHKEAVILASQDESEWPVISPLPSYGRGRDASGGRFISLIFGTNFTDVVITGGNGMIDGQGAYWWGKFTNKQLKTRGPI